MDSVVAAPAECRVLSQDRRGCGIFLGLPTSNAVCGLEGQTAPVFGPAAKLISSCKQPKVAMKHCCGRVRPPSLQPSSIYQYFRGLRTRRPCASIRGRADNTATQHKTPDGWPTTTQLQDRRPSCADQEMGKCKVLLLRGRRLGRLR